MARAADLRALVADLRLAVDAAGGILDGAAYGQTRQLFGACSGDSGLAAALAAAASEYPRAEYLACLAASGQPAAADPALIEDYRETAPGFRCWFQAAAGPDGRPILLVARWLCHLAGLRHPTVQLFLDLPEWPGCLLVQVRGLTRPVAPGCFDLPVAGHVSGLTLPAEALVEEMAQELGLPADSVDGLAPVGQYEHHARNDGLSDREYRFVFRGRLLPGNLTRIRFVDQEVAAVAIFSLPELRALLGRFPERVASGLAASLPLYLPA